MAVFVRRNPLPTNTPLEKVLAEKRIPRGTRIFTIYLKNHSNPKTELAR